MNEEELKKEAEVYLIQHGYGDENRINEWIDIYLAGAEPREKRIAKLEQENNKLLDIINNQDVKIADLEKQIEKMKCCGNCWHWHYDCYDGVVIRLATEQDRRENYKNWGEQIPCKNKDHWKLKE